MKPQVKIFLVFVLLVVLAKLSDRTALPIVAVDLLRAKVKLNSHQEITQKHADSIIDALKNEQYDILNRMYMRTKGHSFEALKLIHGKIVSAEGMRATSSAFGDVLNNFDDCYMLTFDSGVTCQIVIGFEIDGSKNAPYSDRVNSLRILDDRCARGFYTEIRKRENSSPVKIEGVKS